MKEEFTEKEFDNGQPAEADNMTNNQPEETAEAESSSILSIISLQR